MRVLTGRSLGPLALVGAVLPSACSHEWDPYDPRLGEASGGGATSSLATGSGTGTESTASTSSSDGGGTTSSTSSADGGGTSTSGPGGAGGETTSTGDGGGGAGPLTVEYPAAVADCVDPEDPAALNPDICEEQTGEGGLTVDLEASFTGGTWLAYLRFDLDDTLAGHTVESVSLRLTVASFERSSSDQSAEVWEVGPFSRADLFIGVPAPIGGAALAGDQGAVDQGQVVTFSLGGLTPPTPSGSVFLGLVPVSTDGVDYLNADGPNPPTLVVTYR